MSKFKTMEPRRRANLISAALFVLVLALGILTIIGDDDVTSPTATTAVTKGQVKATPEVTNKTTVVTEKDGKESARTTTTQVQGAKPEQPSQTTTTVSTGEKTTLERLLGDGGVVILQVAVVVLAAFLAGAVVQRVLLGKYAFELGPLKVSELAEASTAGIEELKQEIQKLRQDSALAADVKKAQEESHREDAALNRDLALVLRRLDLLERHPGEAT